MKILIAYSSLTGNTKKLATAIEEVLEGSILKNINEIKDYNSLENYDVILVGTWIRRASADPKAQEFISKIHNKKIGFFFTLGAYPDSDYANIRCPENIKELFKKNGNKILGHFHCHGALSKNLQEKVKRRAKKAGEIVPKDKILRWEKASTHPNLEDLENCKKYFTNLLKTEK